MALVLFAATVFAVDPVPEPEPIAESAPAPAPVAQNAPVPVATPIVVPSGNNVPGVPPLAPGSAGIIIRFSSETCAANSASIRASILAQCPTCNVEVRCVTARAGAVVITVTGSAAAVQALTTAIRNGQVAGIPPNATIQQVVIQPNGVAVPATVPPATASPSAWVQVSTQSQITCPTQADCQAYADWVGATGVTVTCNCRASRQTTGFVDIIVAPATGVDVNRLARDAAKALGVCVNVFTPASGLTTPAASACPGKDSKKGLLGLLGLLGLIPLLLCLLLCCLCCLRRRKAARDVHFATFDPAPPNVAMAPVPSVCAPAPFPASVCAPAPVCMP